MSNEPVTLPMALTAAVTATINVVGLLLDWDAKLIAALNIAAAAWVGVLAFWIRGKVAPEAHVRAVAPWVADDLWPPTPPPPPAWVAGDDKSV